MEQFLSRLIKREEVAEGTMAFFFETRYEFSFKAGQYIHITLIDPPKTDKEGDARDFSISSSPKNRGEIMITTRIRGSAFKDNLKNFPLGTNVKITGPMGFFTLHKDSSKPAVFLAGGIGITPERSMIEYVTQEKLPYKIYLFYSNKTPAETVFLDELEKWSKENENFTFIPTITGVKDSSWNYEYGRINSAMIKKYMKKEEMEKSIFYASGPPAMVSAMVKVLAQLGISEEQIKAEEFSGY